MPDTFNTTQLFDRVILLNKVEEGQQQIKAGKGLSTEEAKKKLKKLQISPRYYISVSATPGH